MKQFILLISLLISTSTFATVKPRDGRRLPVEHERQVSWLYKAPRWVGSQANAPLKASGSPKVPVILVQFTDLKFTSGLGTHTEPDSLGNPVEVRNQCQDELDELVVNEFYTDFCNGRGGDYYTGAGSYGAIKEYFRDQSRGIFTPEFVVIGPVTLDKSYKYYGQDSGSHDIHMSDFYKEAIEGAQEVYGNWVSTFDNDGNGSVDMAFFVYAGEGQNGCDDAYTIWPKESSSGGTQGGVTFGCYACCNETYKNTTDGIGVFVHELSHALGLPDFYDTHYVAYGLDYWDVMDSGCYCNNAFTPCNYSAYEREFMGWTTIETLDPSQPRKITIHPSSTYYTDDTNEYKPLAYKMVNPENPDEYYILENRQPVAWDLYVGRGNNYSKMHGMLIFHVDYLKNRWTSNTVNTDRSHQYITILPADSVLDSYMYVEDEPGYMQFMYSAFGDLYPGYYKVTNLPAYRQQVYTTSKSMNQPLFDIRESEDGIITFYYMFPQGDVNRDGVVDINDVVCIINHMAGTTTYEAADVNEDMAVNINDVVAVINIMAGSV